MWLKASTIGIIALALCTAICASGWAQTVLYVRPTGNDANDGRSWATAKRTIQAAINAAPQGAEIRVAQGTYAPITLSKNLALKGGYAGIGANPDDRDLTHTRYPTIIDGGNTTTPITITHANATPLIEGFIIQNGRTPDPPLGIGRTNGGALLLVSGSPTLRYSWFRNNRVQSSNNWGGAGGAIYIETGSPVIENNLFEGNGIFGVNADGGVVYVRFGAPVIRANRFVGNTLNGAFVRGGVVHVEQGNPLIENNEFVNTTIQSTILSGGIVYVARGAPVFRRNQFRSNTVTASSASGGIVCVDTGTPVFENNLFEDNQASSGILLGGAVSVQGAPVLTNNRFIRTVATAGVMLGGALYLDRASGAQVRNNLFVGNQAASDSPDGQGAYGGAIYLEAGGTALYNNTFVANRAVNPSAGGEQPGSAIYANGMNTPIVNNIFAAHLSVAIYHAGANSTRASLAHNCFFNNAPDTAGSGIQLGSGNLFQDPRFVDAANNDYRPRRGSPCIDAGDSSVVNWQTDLDGNPRLQGRAVDIGAYEFQGSALEGDVNGDGCVNNADLLIVLFNFGSTGQGDANGDGVVNNADLLLVLFNFGTGC